MAEKEQGHRHTFEQSAIRIDAREASVGQWLAFAIGALTIICGTYTATHGAQVAGAFIGTGGVVGLVSAFIFGRVRRPPD